MFVFDGNDNDNFPDRSGKRGEMRHRANNGTAVCRLSASYFHRSLAVASGLYINRITSDNLWRCKS